MDRDWANLPANVLDSIVERLESVWDYLQFSLVCRPWCCVAKNDHIQRAKMMSTIHRPPMLLIAADKGDAWNVYNVVDNKVIDLQLDGQNKRFCGSSKGWVIDNFAVTLINPFFRVKGRRNKENSTICLPQLKPPSTEEARIVWTKNFDRYVIKATISADPILDAFNSIVVVIYQPSNQLAFIRLATDTAWTYFDTSRIDDVVCFQGKFFAVDRWSNLLSFDVTACEVEHDAHGVKLPQTMWLVNKYLVDSNGKELLMVRRYYDFDDNMLRTTMKFEVFKMDFNKGKWIKKKTLGDVAIFLGDNSAVSVLASKFPGCEPNCIYFSHDRDRVTIDFRGHGLMDRRIVVYTTS